MKRSADKITQGAKRFLTIYSKEGPQGVKEKLGMSEAAIYNRLYTYNKQLKQYGVKIERQRRKKLIDYKQLADHLKELYKGRHN